MRGKNGGMKSTELILRPYMFNALTPEFIRNLIYSMLINIGIYGIMYIYQLTMKNVFIEFGSLLFYVSFSLSTFAIAFIPVVWKIILLYNTNYYFFDDHVVNEFEFLIVRKKSVMYDKIVDMTIDVSIWDRICKSGDITLHTAENRSPDMKLRYIKEPFKIENHIYDIISRGSNNNESNIHRKAALYSAHNIKKGHNSHSGHISKRTVT